VNTEEAKAQQDYDPNPPRCFECVYYQRKLRKEYEERQGITRRGKPIVRKVQLPRNRANPMIERCTFGNFEVTGKGVCNEWRNRNGERIQSDE
jgi:hypothetical protein